MIGSLHMIFSRSVTSHYAVDNPSISVYCPVSNGLNRHTEIGGIVMPRKPVDFAGVKLGMLTVSHIVDRSKSGNVMWECKCECGGTTVISSSDIRKVLNGKAGRISCGCQWHKKKENRLTDHPLYATWGSMKQRCYNPNATGYERYGGRGITICDEWLESSESFFKWAEEVGYEPGLTLDRIDNDKGYSPDNCRFVDRYVQGANRRAKTNSRTGIVGVSPTKDGKYRVHIAYRGEDLLISHHDTLVDAVITRDLYIIRNGLPHTLSMPAYQSMIVENKD
jgi:hypothetical protein